MRTFLNLSAKFQTHLKALIAAPASTLTLTYGIWHICFCCQLLHVLQILVNCTEICQFGMNGRQASHHCLLYRFSDPMFLSFSFQEKYDENVWSLEFNVRKIIHVKKRDSDETLINGLQFVSRVLIFGGSFLGLIRVSFGSSVSRCCSDRFRVLSNCTLSPLSVENCDSS